MNEVIHIWLIISLYYFDFLIFVFFFFSVMFQYSMLPFQLNLQWWMVFATGSHSKYNKLLDIHCFVQYED